jgi:hypothetical protein
LKERNKENKTKCPLIINKHAHGAFSAVGKASKEVQQEKGKV